MCFLLCTCRKAPAPAEVQSQRLFNLLDSSFTGIQFINQLSYNENINPYTFRNFFNGGGVGLADVNNDGLLDIFLCGNQVSNRLYINKGNLRFEDITKKAGLWSEGIWTTGVSFVDINADGWLDIYICKSGPPADYRRHNELFINNGDLTFSEQSKAYGLDFTGLSVHAAFFDYDQDGDLDCYLLNNSIRSVGQYDLRKDQRNIPDPLGGNKLLRNDNGRFTDVTLQAGIYSSQIGFGLGVAVSDINRDGWPDLYVANDFFEKDYLYINQGNGTFREKLEEMINETSLGSMGADVADLNNDGLPEIFVTEMLPESDYRLKTTSQFENWNKYRENLQSGYYKQFSRNVLQLNNGNGTFSEIGRYAGVHATDWSWGALLFDADNDGWKDIYVANGIFKDLLNQDYVNFVANPVFIRNQIKKGAAVITQLIDTIPSNKLNNYFFRNNGNLIFTNVSLSWVGDHPSFSNGSAYGDLDNDGDLDLVVNNVNMPAFILENLAREHNADNNFLSVQVRGDNKNVYAVGTKVTLIADGKTFYQELFPSRGFMSSVDYRLHFGIGQISKVDTMLVEWNDGKTYYFTDIVASQFISITKAQGRPYVKRNRTSAKTWLTEIQTPPGIEYVHQENDYSDFDYDRLLFIMTSNEGPCLCKGDVNADGLDDFYVGGAKGQAGKLYVQRSNGSFVSMFTDILNQDSDSEDVDCIFLDANQDGFDDLYVGSGGREFSSSSVALIDRLYFSVSGKHLRRSDQVLPNPVRFESTSIVISADYNKDGYPDLFVGGRFHPQAYGLPADSYLLQNDGHGNFTDVTPHTAPGFRQMGMVTSAVWLDVNNDAWPDLLVTGEWMPLRLFINQKGKFTEQSDQWGLKSTHGWYHSLLASDLNNDGLTDFIAGNHGLNSMFRASAEQPLQILINDFDQNGSLEHIILKWEKGQQFPYALLPDLITQIPYLKKRYLYYYRYAGQIIEEILSPEQIGNSLRLSVSDMESAVWINNGNNFIRQSLPAQAQFTPVYAIAVLDIDKDGQVDILLGGNQSKAKPQTGAYEAGYGVTLKNTGEGRFIVQQPANSGFSVRGDMRNIMTLNISGKTFIVVAVNNQKLHFFKPNLLSE